MDFIGIIALLISLSACFMYINYRFIKLPETIGIMVLSLVFSLGMVLFQKIGLLDFSNIANNIDFETMLMKGMLSFLLFAGALHIDINDLVKQNTKYTRTSIGNLYPFGLNYPRI